MPSRISQRLLPALLLPALLLSASVNPATSRADPWPSPAQVELVRERHHSLPQRDLVSAVDWYSPLEIVRGAAHPQPLARRAPGLRDAGRRGIAKSALDQAVAYAASRKTYALLVWHNDGLELETYWPGFDRESLYETASLHKAVVALTLGAVIADGKVGSVDDPLARYLPELAGTRRGRIPLRQLLTMTSGIETPPTGGDDSTTYWQYYFGDDLKAAAAHWPDTCAAGREFCYANANTQYLGWVIEAATHQRYADYLSQRLWRPLGAADARVWLDHPGGSPRFSCCLQANARDWIRVGRLLLDHGRAGGRQLVPATWIRQMSEPSLVNPNFGWQIWRGSPYLPVRTYGKTLHAAIPAAQPFLRHDVVYLDGSAGQRVYVVPSEKLVIVRIGAPSTDWDDSLLPNLIMAGLR